MVEKYKKIKSAVLYQFIFCLNVISEVLALYFLCGFEINFFGLLTGSVLIDY